MQNDKEEYILDIYNLGVAEQRRTLYTWRCRNGLHLLSFKDV
jgi:hypothetical protein